MIPFAAAQFCRQVAAASAGSISYVGGKAMQWDSTGVAFDFTSLTGGLASTPSPGDFALILLGTASNTTMAQPSFSTVPSGMALVSGSGLSSNSSSISCRADAYSGFIPSGTLPTGTIAGNGGSSGSYCSGGTCHVFRGVNATPFDAACVTALGTGNLADAPAITTVSAGAWVIEYGCTGHNQNAMAFGNPTDVTDIINNPHGGLLDFACLSGVKRNFGAGTFNPNALTFGTNNSAHAWGAMTFAIKPA